MVGCMPIIGAILVGCVTYLMSSKERKDYMIKLKTLPNGKRALWILNRIKITFHSQFYLDYLKGNSSYWIDFGWFEIKIKRNYKGHFIC